MVSSCKLLRLQTVGRGHDDWYFCLPSGAALALLLAAMLSGCATTGSNPYPYFERLSIEALSPTSAEENDAVPSAGESIAIGATAGAMGSLVTGLAVSLLCGPFFAVCFAGTGVATLGGATVGAAMAGSTVLSSEDAERVTRYLEDLQQTRNLSDELAAAVTVRLPAARLSVPRTADAHLGLEAQGLSVLPGFEDTIALWVAVKANLEWDLDQAKPRQTSRSFACQTKLLPLEDWLSTGNTEAEQELTHCIDKLALEVSTALQKPGPDKDSASPIGFGNYDPATSEW